jgi:hypothetical protein
LKIAPIGRLSPTGSDPLKNGTDRTVFQGI